MIVSPACLVNPREREGVSRQAVECFAVGKLAAKDSIRPVIVELHVVAVGKEMARRSDHVEDDELNEKRPEKNQKRSGNHLCEAPPDVGFGRHLDWMWWEKIKVAREMAPW